MLYQNCVWFKMLYHTQSSHFKSSWWTEFEMLLGGWMNFVQKGSQLSYQCECCRIWFVCKLWENNTWYTYDIVKSTRVLFWQCLLWGRIDWLQNLLLYVPGLAWHPRDLFALVAAGTLQHWATATIVAAGLAATKWSCLSPVLVLVDCWLLSTVKCHFSVITFGNCGSVLFQLQIHYINLQKSTYFQILILI